MLIINAYKDGTGEEYTVNDKGQKSGIYRKFDKSGKLIIKSLMHDDIEIWSQTKYASTMVFQSISGLTIVKYYNTQQDITEICIAITDVCLLLRYSKKTSYPYSQALVNTNFSRLISSAKIGSNFRQAALTYLTLGNKQLIPVVGLISSLPSWPKIVDTEVEEIVDALYYEFSPHIGVF